VVVKYLVVFHSLEWSVTLQIDLMLVEDKGQPLQSYAPLTYVDGTQTPMGQPSGANPYVSYQYPTYK
jgi:hypothetical protein